MAGHQVGRSTIARILKAAGFVEKRTGKGSHALFVHPESGKEVWVTMHGHDAGRIGDRILRDARVESNVETLK